MHVQWPMICERERVERVVPHMMDVAWARGWRHFGRDFFRDSITLMEGRINRVTPLRVLLNQWTPSKSERRTLRKNAGFEVVWKTAEMSADVTALFHLHKERFIDNKPEGLDNFLGWSMTDYPCECMMCCVYDKGKLIAASYLDIGDSAVSSVYGMFHPDYRRHRLGIFTMLAEMQYAQQKGYEYYYSGYATIEPSCYDYKKSFRPQEYYAWLGEWKPLQR